MKTKASKTTEGSARKLSSILAASITWLLPAFVLILPIESSFAESATWLEDPSSGDWNFVGIKGETNWTGNVVPNGPADTATFASSNITDVFLSANTEVNGIVFNPGADAFTITAGNGFMLTISGAGIINNSGITQNFATSLSGSIVFTNSATAGNLTAFTNQFGGVTQFEDSSTADHATIQNLNFGSTSFFNSSTADHATIQNLAFGITSFLNSSTAANAMITNSGEASVTEFFNSSTADHATIQNLDFGTTSFFDSSTAGNATITNVGVNSRIEFFGNSSGGVAALINANDTAVIDISGLTLAGTTAGSIAGNGSLFLGDKNLTVGGNQTSTVFSGMIQDGGASGGAGGSLTKVGAGVLTLTGDNTYTGATTVDGGSLIVDGSINSPETLVNPGGLLGGNGTIGGNVTNSGIVSPGNPFGTNPGTLHVSGTYTQTETGTLRIEIAPNKNNLNNPLHDLLAVNREAILSGTLEVILLKNVLLPPGVPIIFLTASDGVKGTFDRFDTEFANGMILQIVPFQNGNGLSLVEAIPSKEIAPEELTAIFSSDVAQANSYSRNLEHRCDDIRKSNESSESNTSSSSIDRRVPEFSQGLAGPTGPEGKSGPSVMQSRPENRWGVFVTGLGEFTSVDSTSVAPGYNFSTGGFMLGVDYRVSPYFAIGLTGGYAHTNADLVNNGSLDVNGGTIGAYATAFGGGFYVNTAATGTFSGYDEHRTALLGTASGNTDGQDFNALVEAGYDWKRGGLTIGPLASFQYTYVGLDGFTEHGSLAPLSFNNQNAESTRTALGAKASYDWHVGHVVVRPELRAAWQHEFGDTDYSIVSRFASGAGNSFTVNGPAIGRDSLLIGAGAAVLLNDRVSVYAYYDGELARTNYSSNNVSAGLRFTF